MLIRYKKSFEKIAMGLLSFMPEEKEVKKLQHTMKEYETNSNWQLFLWKEEDILGAVGVIFPADQEVLVQHISVNPSHRSLGIGRKMIEGIKDMYQDYKVVANSSTQAYLDRLQKREDT